MPLPQNRYDPGGFTTPGSYALPRDDPQFEAALQMLAAPGSAAGLGSAMAAGPVIGAGPQGSRMLADAWKVLPERIKAILARSKTNWLVGTKSEIPSSLAQGIPPRTAAVTSSPADLERMPRLGKFSPNTGYIVVDPVYSTPYLLPHELVHAAQFEVGDPIGKGVPFRGIFENFVKEHQANYSNTPYYKRTAKRLGISTPAFVAQTEGVPFLTNPKSDYERITPEARNNLLALIELMGRGGSIPPSTQRYRAGRAGQEW